MLGLLISFLGGPLAHAEETLPQGAIEERAVPQFPARPSVAVPAPSLTPSVQVMSAYRAALNQPAVRSAADAEIRRQLRTIQPIAFVNGVWVTPIDVSAVYSQAPVRASLMNYLQGVPGGLQGLNTMVAGRTDVALIFTPNHLADMLQIPRADVMRMLGVDALRVKATDGYLNPQTSGVNVYAAWGYIKEAFNWMAAWWQNHQNEKQQQKTRDNCQDKGPTGDCDGDGVSNEDDACPYDPDCKHEKGSFVGCVIITCQTFTTNMSLEFESVIQQITTQIRQAGPAGQITPLGQTAMGQPSIGIVFPPGIR
jgi:hypothetical protein